LPFDEQFVQVKKRTPVEPNTQEIQGTGKNETLGADIVADSIGSNIF
jgi:hypothetical protein